MTPIVIEQATSRDLPEAAAVLATAFADDPVMRAIAPGNYRRHGRLTDLFLAMMRSGPFAAGAVDVARRADDIEILGVAAWEGPESGRGAFLRQLRELPVFVRALGWAGVPRALRLQRMLERHRPRTPHWYLGEVGVSPAAQGLGVGGRLLRTRLAALDEARASAYLESSTPENRRLYRRLGFREAGMIAGVPGAAPARMVRVPGAAGEPAR